MNSTLSYNPETLNLGQYWRFFASCDPEIPQVSFKTNRASLLCLFKLYASFHIHQCILIWVPVRKRSNRVKFDDFSSPCDLEISRMTLKNNSALPLNPFKLYASFHSHWWIQIWVSVRKRSDWVKFDNFCLLWHWNFTDDLGKQWGTCSIRIQALGIIS